MSIFSGINNPGVDIDELTSAEEAFVQNLAGLSYASGDILYHDGTDLQRLPKGNNGDVLSLSSGIPAWGAAGSGDMNKVTYDVNNVASDAFTMTNMDATAWRLFYSDASGDVAELTFGTSGQVLKSNGTSSAPSWVDAGAGDVTAASSFGTDNVLIRSDGVNKGVQATGITIDDTTDAMSGVGSITIDASGSLAFGAITILSDSSGTTTLQNIDALDATTESTIEAAIDTLPNLVSVGTITTGVWNGTDIAIADGGTGASDAATARTNLGLEIGTDVQAYDATLASISSLGTASDKIAYTTGVDTWAETAITSFGRSLIDDADAATARTTIGLGNVENTALSTWAGSANITTVGTVTSGNVDAAVSDASATTKGKVELATAAETDTGTDATRAVTPDGLQGSIRNLRFVDFIVVDAATDCATGTDLVEWEAPFAGTIVQDDTHKAWFSAWNATAGTTGTMTVDIHKDGTTIMTTNKLDIETGETSTRTATTQPDLTTTTFSEGDLFTIDIDAIHSGTAAKGLTVRMAVRPD